MNWKDYTNRMSLALLGLMAGCLILFTAGCGSKAPDCPPLKVITPPAVLMQDVPEPRLKGKTNAALAEWAVELREVLRVSNGDKRALREWAVKAPSPAPNPN